MPNYLFLVSFYCVVGITVSYKTGHNATNHRLFDSLSCISHAANTQENSTLWLYRNFLKGCYISLERWFYKDQENWGCNFQKLVRAEKLTLRGPIWPPSVFPHFFSKPARIFQKEIYMVLETSICDHLMVDSLLGVDPYPKLWGTYKKPYLRFHRFCL